MSTAMEQFFTPTQRYQDRFDDDDGPVEYTEVELAVPVEDFLSYRWDWEALRVLRGRRPTFSGSRIMPFSL